MDFTQLRNFPLKVIFLCHFVLISFATLGSWSPSAYLFYNSLLIAFLLWGIVVDHEEPIQMAIVVNGFSIVLDIFVLIFDFPLTGYGRDVMSAGMAVIHLLFRPFTCIYMAKIIQQRVGTTGPITSIGDIFPPSRDRNYEDIDHNVPPPHPNQGGYNFSTAQQL